MNKKKSMLEEIQEGSIDNSIPLSTLLLKCKLLASRANVRDMETWVDYELEGYPKEIDVPEYRILPMQILGNFVSPRYQMTDHRIPPSVVKEATGHHRNKLHYINSIAEIEHLTNDSSGHVGFDMGDLNLLLNRKVFQDATCISAWGQIHSSDLVAILSRVRKRVLDLSINLNKEYPEAGTLGAEMSEKEEKGFGQIFNTTVYGNANIVGSATDSNIEISIIQGDFSTLQDQLKKAGLGKKDIKELEKAIAVEPKTSGRNFPSKVSEWIGKMVGKAASGSWKVSIATASDILTKLISKYYGLN